MVSTVHCSADRADYWLVFDDPTEARDSVGEIQRRRAWFEVRHRGDEQAAYAFRDLQTAEAYFNEYFWALGFGVSSAGARQ